MTHYKKLLLYKLLLLPLISPALYATEDSTQDLLTPEHLVSAVLLANPNIEIAQAAWEASTARIEQHSAFADPMFSYSMAPLTIGSNRSDYGQRIEISQTLPWSGKRQLRSESASHQADAAQQTANSLRIKLAATSKILFADWYYIHQAIGINLRNQDLLKEFRAIAVSRYSTGLANKQDALQAEMESALLEHQTIVLQREKSAIRTHINTLLNVSPDQPLAPPTPLARVIKVSDIQSLQQQALQARPELKALASSIAAAQAQSELAVKNYYPDISLKAGYNSLWADSNKHFTVGVGFNLPLFQAKYKAAENEALAQIKQVEWQRVDFLAQLKKEIQLSYDRTHESIHVLHLHQQKLLPLAKATLDAAESDYQSSKGSFLSLIRSEKNYMQIQLQTEKSLADTHRRLAELESAVGYLQPFSTSP